MKKISLTKEMVAIVDDSDFERVSRHKWSYHHTGYAVRGKPQISMHHFIYGRPPKGKMVDHKNGNKLDNRKENLRFCTNRQNQYNSRPLRDVPRNVYWREARKAWVVRIKSNGKRVFVGYFKDLEKATVAARAAIKRAHGEFAYVATS